MSKPMDIPAATWDKWLKSSLSFRQTLYQSVDKILDQQFLDKPVPQNIEKEVDFAFKQAFQQKEIMSEFRKLLDSAYQIIGLANNPRVNILTNAENTPQNRQDRQQDLQAPWDTREPGAPSPSMNSVADQNFDLDALRQSNDPNEKLLYQLSLKIQNQPKLRPTAEPEIRNTLKQEYKYTPPKLRPAGQ